MESIKKNIETKIKKNFEIIDLKIIDNSGKHKGHKFFDEKRALLKLIIKSPYLTSLNRVESHKKIMRVLKSEIKISIHALQIEII